MSKLAAAEVCLDAIGPRFSVKSLWMALSHSFAKVRCQVAHKSISRPVNGKYRCWTCLREFETGW